MFLLVFRVKGKLNVLWCEYVLLDGVKYKCGFVKEFEFLFDDKVDVF